MSALIFLLAVAAIFGTVLAAEARAAGDASAARPLGLIGWLTGGNWPAKIGGGLLLVGLGALLRYALLNLDLPPPVKLGGGVVAAGVLGVAATLTRIGSGRRAVSLALGGAAFGVAYITAYSAFALFHYYDSFTGTAALALVAVGAAVYAVTRSALSLALLAMLGAYLAPAFATSDPGPAVVYGHLAFASLLTLAMVAARGWRPLIHLSLLFTLGGGVFFAWTARYFEPQYAASMLPLVLLLSAIQALMPLLERRGAQQAWIERLDLAHLLALPVLAGLAALAIAPTRVELSNELIGLAAIWVVLALCLALLKREGAVVHAIIGVLFAGLATAARLHDLPWELIGLAFTVLALWLAARYSRSQYLQHTLAALVPIMGLLAVMSSLAAAPGASVHAQFVERVIGAALLMFAGHVCRRIRNTLDTLLWTVGAAWLLIAVGAEVLRWHLASLPVLVHWALLVAAAALAFFRVRHRLLPEALFAVVAGVLVTTSWAAAASPTPVSWLSLAVAPLVLVWLSIRRAGADPATRTGRMLAAATAPIVAGLWAIHDGHLVGIDVPQFALCAMVVTALLIVALSGLAYERSVDWRAAATRIYATGFAAVLAVATTLAISRSTWAVALELLALAGLALVAMTQSAAAPAPKWVAPACALGAGLTLQADLLRWFGPAGALRLEDIAHMRLTGLVSLLWAALGALLTVWAKSRASRALWVAGATLMVAAAVKFVLFDFGGLGQLGNILAVIAAGVVFLLVGWLAPMPPAAAPRDAPAASPPAAPQSSTVRVNAPAAAARTGAATQSVASAPPASGAMDEYYRHNVSATAPAAGGAGTADAGGRMVWMVVVLALLVLPLSQCGRPRVNYGNFGGLAGATPRPALVTATPLPPRTRATQMPKVTVTPAPVQQPEQGRDAPAAAAPDMPPSGAAASAARQAGVYKCVQPDGSMVFAEVPCAQDAERVELPRTPHPGAAATGAFAAPQIVSAVYASPRNGAALDVTTQLRAGCTAASCNVLCGNQLAGDPDFGQGKYCGIAYRCGNGPGQELHVREGERFVLSCRAGAGTGAPR
jgi:uncharacterized membrane protein